MKSTFKRIGIIVFVAVIGFSMIACNLFGGKEEEQETQKTNTQTPGDQIPGTDPNHDHVWGDWSVTTAATCSATGVETRTCALDSSHTETRDIAINPSAHNWIAKGTPVRAATCTEDGIGARKCELCGVENNDPNGVIPALGHDYNWAQTTAPTCTAAGIETGTCTHDASHTTTRAGAAALGHDWEWVTTATVTTDGTETKTCNRDSAHNEVPRTAYATGTAGLAFEAIGNTAYRVRKGTVTTGAVHIPAYHRLNVDSQYQPVTEIGVSSDSQPSGAFYNTSITTVTFAQNSQLKTIGGFAFSSRTSLTSITIPAGVTSIGVSAFSRCTGLTSVTIPTSVTSIGVSAFSECTGLTSIMVDAGNPNYTSDSGILYNKAKTTLIQAPGAISGSVTIPSTVTSINNSAFSGCTSLTSVTIPAGVTSINNSAFSGCTSLTSVTIPASVTSIGMYAFSYCRSLTSVTIPAGVTSIDWYTFNSCTGLTSITIPAGVTSIGSFAFNSCTGLTSVTIPASVTSIGQQAFNECTGLTGVITIPAGVTSIGDIAFSNCSSLTSITIPASVTSIGERAFSSWTASQTINVQGKANQAAADAAWGADWRSGCNATINYNG